MFARTSIIVGMIVATMVGCIAHRSKVPQVTQVTAPFERYVSPTYNWNQIQRIVIIPFGNQTPFTHVGEEMQTNLAAELQRFGRYDVVVANWEDPAVHAEQVFVTGQFNELELLRLAREHQADAVLMANVTQYHPYLTPRLGVSLLLVSPLDGIVIGSASGMWDARETNTAVQMREYYKTTQYFPRSLMASDRVAESPNVFQRYVCNQLASALDPQNTHCGVNGPQGMNGQPMPNLPSQPYGMNGQVVPGQATIMPQGMTPLPEPYPFPNGAIESYQPPPAVPPVMNNPTPLSQ